MNVNYYSANATDTARVFSAKKMHILLIILVASLLLLSGCQSIAPVVTTGEIGVIEDTKFGSVYTELSIDEFCQKGFAFGDSIDVTFDNGFKLEDIPFYNGYYTKVGDVLACGYPGYAHVAITRNNVGSLWEDSGVTADSKMTITLREKGKYLAVQESLGLVYSNERSDFSSDEVFANFRAMTGGDLKENTFYRSASPCDNCYSRAAYADALAAQAGIRYVLNLSDNEEDFLGLSTAEDFCSPYYLSLYENGNVAFLDMNTNYRSEHYANTIANALLIMCDHEGPVLIHCLEGKDRTGFVCALLLALSGADAQEITTDYMITYENYYGVSRELTPEKVDAIISIKANDFLYFLSGADENEGLTDIDFCEGAKSYLRFGGLTDEQITAVVAYLSK